MSTYLNERGFFKKTELLKVAVVDQDYVFLYMDLREFPADTKPPEPFILDAPTFELGDKEVVQWNGQAWRVVENHVGEAWYKKLNGEAVTINNIGAPSNDLTDKARPDQFHVWDTKKNGWVLDKSLKQDFITAQNTDQKAMLKADAEERITLIERKVKLKRATEQDLTMLDLLYGFTLDLDDLGLTQENVAWPKVI